MHKNRLLFLTLPFLLSSELVLSSSSSSSKFTSSSFTPVATVLSEEKEEEEIKDMAYFIFNELGATFEYPKGLNPERAIDSFKILTGIKLRYEENREEYCKKQIALLPKKIKELKAAYASFLKTKPNLKKLAEYNKTYKPSLESLENELTSLVSSKNSKTRNLRADEFQSIKEDTLEELQTCLPDFKFQKLSF